MILSDYMEEHSPQRNLESLISDFNDYSIDEYANHIDSQAEETVQINMAQQLENGFAAKVTSSVVDKKARQDTVQNTKQKLKNLTKGFTDKTSWTLQIDDERVSGSFRSGYLTSVDDLESETLKFHGVTKSESFRRDMFDRSSNNTDVVRCNKPMELRKKAKVRNGLSRRKFGDRKNKSSVSSPHKVFAPKQTSAVRSFNESPLPANVFSRSNSSEKTCQDETFDLVLDDKGPDNIIQCNGPSDHQTSQKNIHRNHLRQSELDRQNLREKVQEFDSFTVLRNGCGIPWSWSGTRKRTGKRLMGIAGKRFSCGFPVSNRRNLVSRNVHGLHSQEPVHIESTDSEFISSDDYSMEDAPLINIPPENEFSFDSSVDGHCGFLRSGCFGELDLHSLTRTRKLGARECKPKDESIRIDEDALMHGSLCQKYRPRSFEELVGQNLVAQALSNAIIKGKIAPIYLFHGPRGTGKTSTARIFASALNCISDLNAKPCGNCRGCSKRTDITEIDAATSKGGIESMKILLQSISLSRPASHYKVFVLDECHILTSDAWNSLLNALEEEYGRVVFIMITTDSTKLPRIALSRCQKFCFPKIKDGDIFVKLEKITAAEHIDIEESALHLIVAKADGSLRDAEMTLEQLSLLGTKVTTAMVRQLVGLIPADKLIDLLDLALSAETVRTVRSTREIIDSGVEPLALVSQLASLITDILAGGSMRSEWLQENTRFFSRHFSSRDESERLRQALKILAETEKQLRSSNDRTTWLTAALLQFAPDDFYPLPASALGTSITQSPAALLDTCEKETAEVEHSVAEQPWQSDDHWEHYQLQLKPVEKYELSANDNSGIELSLASPEIICDFQESSSNPFQGHNNLHHRTHSSGHSQKLGVTVEDLSAITESDNFPAHSLEYSGDVSEAGQKELKLMNSCNIQEIWQKVLERIQSTDLKELLHSRGKLVSLPMSKGKVREDQICVHPYSNAIVHLNFRHPQEKELAENSGVSISSAFQVVLGYPVEVKIRLGPTVDGKEIPESTAAFTNNHEDISYFQEKDILSFKTERRQKSRAVKSVLPHVQKRDRIVGMPRKMPKTSEPHAGRFQICSNTDEMLKECNLNQDSSSLSMRRGRAHVASSKKQMNGGQFEGAYAEDWQMQQRSCTLTGTLSHSFVQQADGSIEAYSQDLSFDHANPTTKLGEWRTSNLDTSIFKAKKTSNRPKQVNVEPVNHSRCSGLLCWNEVQVKQPNWRQRRVKFLLKFAPCTKSSVRLNASKLSRTS